MDLHRETINQIVRSTGHPPPQTVFPAYITGVAKAYPLMQGRDSPSVTIDAAAKCTDPVDLDNCSLAQTHDAEGFYPDEFLPCGVYPTRYRWRAVDSALTSEGCGLRQDDQGDWIKWRQALYAVNVSHSVQDSKLDYPYVKPGTAVIMYFARLSNMPGYSGGTGWGFAFVHHSDPPGTQTCPPGAGFEPQGCCIITLPGGGTVPFCADEASCDAFNDGINTAEFLGIGVNCPEPPSPPIECQGGAGGGVIPAGLPAAWVPPPAQPDLKAVRVITPWHKLAGAESEPG